MMGNECHHGMLIVVPMSLLIYSLSTKYLFLIVYHYIEYLERKNNCIDFLFLSYCVNRCNNVLNHVYLGLMYMD